MVPVSEKLEDNSSAKVLQDFSSTNIKRDSLAPQDKQGPSSGLVSIRSAHKKRLTHSLLGNNSALKVQNA
jgi:hypothetical protein